MQAWKKESLSLAFLEFCLKCHSFAGQEGVFLTWSLCPVSCFKPPNLRNVWVLPIHVMSFPLNLVSAGTCTMCEQHPSRTWQGATTPDWPVIVLFRTPSVDSSPDLVWFQLDTSPISVELPFRRMELQPQPPTSAITAQAPGAFKSYRQMSGIRAVP